MSNVALTFGSYYFSGSSATDNIADTPIKAAGTTTVGFTNGFTHVASNRLVYNGAITRTFEIIATVSVSSSGATESKMHLYKNGTTLIAGSTIDRTIGAGSDVGAVAITALVSLDEDDFIELWCESDNSADDITIEAGTVLIKVVG